MAGNPPPDSQELEQALNGLKPGDHVCCIYATDEERRALLTPFMTRGLDLGEKVIYIVDVRKAEDVLGYLHETGVEVDRYLKTGQLKVRAVAKSWGRGTAFDPDGVISLLKQETERALAESFSALRVTGELTWVLRKLPGSNRLLEYEAKLDEFVSHNKCLSLCQYDSRRFAPGLLLDALATHPTVIVGKQLFENFYYVQPKYFLGPDPEAARLDNWLRNLEGRKARDELEFRVQERTEELSKVNAQLRLGQAKYRTVADFTADWEYWEGPDAVFYYHSPSCEQISGRKPWDFLNSPSLVHDIILAEDRPVWDEHYRESHREKRPGQLQFRIRRSDGQIVWIEHFCRPVLDEQGEFLGIRASNRDITDRKQAEAESRRLRNDLAHISRVTTLGEMAAAIAHEINQPLAAILNNAQAAQRFLAGEEPNLKEVREALGDIVEDDRRAGDVIRRVRAVLRKEEPNREPLDVNAMIDEILLLIRSELVTRDLELAFHSSDNLPAALGDRVQLQQVALNLVRNALEAMADGPRSIRGVSICTRRDGPNIVVSVCDAGPPISDEALAVLFEPFSTTKPDGLGMGLSISRSIVEAHGGRIWAERNTDRGLTVHFTLPCFPRTDTTA